MLRLSLFLLSLLMAGSLAAADFTRHPFETTIVREVKTDGVPGMAYAILEEGQWKVGTVGVRSLKGRKPVTEETLFPLASVSKTFAGTLAAMLVAEGQLDINTPLKEDWPGFRLAPRGVADRITVAHLLSHTAGVVPNAYDNLIEAGKTIPEIIPSFKKVKPLCQPGNCYGYQNVMFSLAEPALAEAGGEAYPQLVTDRLFGPIGMADSGVGFAFYNKAQNKAVPHVKGRGRWYQRRHKVNYYRATPAAGVNASIRDLVLWVDAMMGKRPEVISDDAIKLATSPRINSTRERWRRHWRDHVTATWYALGWRIFRFEGRDVILHGGGVTGFRTLVSFLPEEGKALVLLFNGETRIHDKIASAFWSHVVKQTPARPVATAR